MLLKLKRMKKAILLIFISFLSLYSTAQDILQLKDCYDLAINHYPLIKQKDVFKNLEENRMNQLDNKFLPTVNLNLQASYQSDVTMLSIDETAASAMGMNLPNISKDQYKANLEIQQLIWDGGITREQKKIESLDRQINDQDLEVELYKIKDRINQLFFNNMLLEKQLKILSLSKENLLNNIKALNHVVEQGMALKSDVDLLSAEVFTIDQQLTGLYHNRLAILNMLGFYIGKELKVDQKFEFNENELNLGDLEINRPELRSFELNREKQQASMLQIDASKLPIISGNGQFGYGRPALNMLSNNFDTYYKVGINLTWKIWDWNKKNTDKKLLGLRTDMIKNQQETFEHNIWINYKQNNSEVNKLEAFLVQDQKIIELRTNLSATAEFKLKKGSLTSAEYLTEFNKETQSKLNFEYHKIQLALAKLNLKYNLGQL